MLNLLVVDDDAVDRMTLRRGLARAQLTHRVIEAPTGADALFLLRGAELSRARPLVLLDLNMPRMHGLEFLRALRADDNLCATPVVVMTTSASEQDRTEAFRLNCAGYFLKPFEFRNFIDLLVVIDRYWTQVQFAP